jgi:hypothetical protein
MTRICFEQSSTPEDAGIDYRKPNSKKNERADEVKSGADTEFAILSGEEPLPFEMLRTKVAEEWAPDGPVEEDLVNTIAKCIWRKQRHQPFAAANYDPKSKGYEEICILNQFRILLELATDERTEEHEITEFHALLGGYFEYHLTTRCPRGKFNDVAEWVEALKTEIDTVLKPVDDRIGPLTIAFIDRSGEADHDLFAREIEFEERNDAMLDRALDQLGKIRAAKRGITFLEARRFSKTHLRRLRGSNKL